MLCVDREYALMRINKRSAGLVRVELRQTRYRSRHLNRYSSPNDVPAAQAGGGGKRTNGEGEMTGYADKRGRWGWMLFDWASQPYHTLIITFIFAPYFASTVVPDPVTADVPPLVSSIE